MLLTNTDAKLPFAPPKDVSGLSSAEAAARFRADGPNELPNRERRRLPRIVRDVLSEPMFGLLLASGIIYLLLGDRLEALLLLVFASLSVGIAVVQETRSERVIEALRDLTSPRALVIRDGSHQRIAGREVVRGDLVLLSEGDRVPADGVLIEARELLTDESLLTGESVPVRKVAKDQTEGRSVRAGGDDLPFVFSGTLVVRGHGLAEVQATGSRSEIGRIGSTLEGIEVAPARLTRQTARIVRTAAALGGVCCVIAVILYGLLRGTWLNALLGGVALGMAMLPEEFPLVLTVFMVMGAWRMSRARVLTRRASAIETLGEATVLCTDKTGTLTQNLMSVVRIETAAGSMLKNSGTDESVPDVDRTINGIRQLSWTDPSVPVVFQHTARGVDIGDCLSPDAPLEHVAATGSLASAPQAYDPMDRAFHDLAQRWHVTRQSLTLARHYALQPQLLAVTYAWQMESNAFLVAAKGAPEAIAELCRMSEAERTHLHIAADSMALAGMRVLGIAEADHAGELPETSREFAFRFLGLAGIADPLRESVPAAIEECRRAGIRVVMITGDYPVTASAIARQAGLDFNEVLDGPSIALLTDEQLNRAVQSVSVFARIVPAQKLRIVHALQSHGDVVAMTGDGVNDAPALKAADIGIAMGQRGTDVAREAASLVLLDDEFGSIVRTVSLGRRIYDNLRKAMAYIVAVHVPVAGLAIFPLVAGLPLIFGPIHIAFMEMVIDPVCSMVFEAEESEQDVMSRPPRATTSPLFSRALVIWGLLQGTVALLPLGLIYWLALRRGMPEGDARALTFVSLVLIDLGLVLVNRSFSAALVKPVRNGNRALWYVTAVTVSLLACVLMVPGGRRLFHFGPLHWDDLSVVLLLVALVVVVLDLLKRLWRTKLVS